MGDSCCQIPNDTITSGCRLWLSHVSPAYVRPAFPVCKKLAGGVECLTEGLSFDARESFLFIEASFQFGMKHSREGETVVLTVCRNATWKTVGNTLGNKFLCFVDGFGENVYLCLYENGKTESRKVCCVRSSGIIVWTCPSWFSVVSYWLPLCN